MSVRSHGQVGPLSYGRWGNRFPQRHSRTALETFASRGSSVQGPLSLALSAVDFIVAVTVKHH
ncbi:MAG: hypothetical protein GY833_00765 [Aestuariibacter sp.]|nr:hypothetical protein [Aestuariibacter sp.]